MKTSILLLAGICSSLAFGCNKASDEQQDAVKAQQEANEEISEAKVEARDKAVSAQAEADKEIAEAQANFMKLREDFRHETTTKLVELDKEITEIEAEAKTLNGTKKAELETKLTSIRSMREQFSTDYAAIETASATTWDATKVRLEKQWKALEDAVDAAH